MIASFRHKSLRQFFEDGRRSGLNAQHLEKLELILSTLHAADTVQGMNLPSFRLHPLSGDLKGFWAVTVRANWRVVFRFEAGKAYDVDLIDYH